MEERNKWHFVKCTKPIFKTVNDYSMTKSEIHVSCHFYYHQPYFGCQDFQWIYIIIKSTFYISIVFSCWCYFLLTKYNNTTRLSVFKMYAIVIIFIILVIYHVYRFFGKRLSLMCSHNIMAVSAKILICSFNQNICLLKHHGNNLLPQ